MDLLGGAQKNYLSIGQQEDSVLEVLSQKALNDKRAELVVGSTTRTTLNFLCVAVGMDGPPQDTCISRS